MITNIITNLDELSAQKKTYKWKKPVRCPRCQNNKVHGHGFVTRIFQGYKEPMFLRRYRCPKCRCVITLRPCGYWPSYQSSIKDIFGTLKYRLLQKLWPPWVLRQRAGHWFRKFVKKVKMDMAGAVINLLQHLENFYEKQLHFLV